MVRAMRVWGLYVATAIGGLILEEVIGRVSVTMRTALMFGISATILL